MFSSGFRGQSEGILGVKQRVWDRIDGLTTGVYISCKVIRVSLFLIHVYTKWMKTAIIGKQLCSIFML